MTYSNGEGGTQIELYEPINVLKTAALNIWIVDGPEIELHYGALSAPFPTRMTVIRLANGSVLLHSPIAYTEELEAAVTAIGPIRYILAPNTLHYWWVPDWKARLPHTRVYATAALKERAKRKVPVDATIIGHYSPWPDDIDVLTVTGDLLTEIVLFHRLSRTLILTDLIENFEPKRVRGWFYRNLIRISGAADPDGKAPIDMQLSFFRHRRALRAAVEKMISWEPERIIVAHGRWYQENEVAELKRAFRWVL